MLREAVYHSFRLDGRWSPYIGAGRKFPRRNPGIFKVQVQRLVADGETPRPRTTRSSSSSSFLVPAIEREIKAAAEGGRRPSPPGDVGRPVRARASPRGGPDAAAPPAEPAGDRDGPVRPAPGGRERERPGPRSISDRGPADRADDATTGSR